MTDKPKMPAGTGFDHTVPASQRYRILGRIASGGMAEIYLALMKTSSGNEREVVLKRLMPELQSDHEFVQMFYDEARIASQMRHPNIVTIYELGELDGSLFISMELLRGVNLRDLLARVQEKRETIPVPYGVRIACGALEALAYAHKFTDANGRLLNVVHRDVSPQNIIVTYDGMVKLVDFGVSKAEGRLHQTRAGLIKGKFAYMSPEQISGGKVDGRSDMFALAEVFYEMFLRRHPFYATTDMEVLRAILDADPPHPCSVDQGFPPDLAAIFLRALRKNPQERFPNAGAMSDALEAFLQHKERTPVTTIVLGRYVRERFAERVQMEERARATGDERLLIESMTAGRAEPVASRPKRLNQNRTPARSRKESAPKPAPSARSGRRDKVVETAEVSEDGAAPLFMAHSGYTDSGTQRRRFQSQAKKMFEDPSEPIPPEALARSGTHEPEDGPTDFNYRADPKTPSSPDDELPTMLGSLNVEDLERLRNKNAERDTKRKAQATPGKPVTSGPTARAKPATPRGSPASTYVTTRVRPTHPDESIDAPPPSDRFGLFLFVAGLGALVGAIVYSIILYTGSQTPLMRLEVRSTPPGASILFDGADTLAQTPSVFQNIASNREHTLELRLDGYEPHTRRLPASPDLGELVINWTFKPVN